MRAASFSMIVLLTISPLIATVALKMGPIEIFALMIFAFSIISGLVGDSMVKGVISAALGLFCATIGLDPENSTPRFIFEFYELYDGLPLVSVALGTLAVSEILRRLASIRGNIKSTVTSFARLAGMLSTSTDPNLESEVSMVASLDK